MKDLTSDSEMETTADDTSKPVGKSVYYSRLGFAFLGISSMICYNLFLQELGYFKSVLHPKFPEWATMTYGISNNIGQLLSIVFAARISYANRLIPACAGLSTCLVGMAILAMIRPPFATAIGLILIAGMGVFSAVHLTAACGLSAAVSGKAMDYMSLGTALAGLLGWPLVLGITYLFTKMGLSSIPTGDTSQVESMTVLVVFIIGALICICFIPYFIVEMQSDYQVLLDDESEAMPILKVLSRVFGTALIAWLILFVTFLVFPSEVLRWKPSYSNYPGGGTFFYSNMLMYTFQVFDVVGRYVSMLKVNLSSRFLMHMTWPRVFIAIMFYCATYDFTIFGDDICRLVLVAIFASSNGCLISWVLRFGGEQAGPTAGSIVSFALVNGIFFGSIISLAIGGPSPSPTDKLDHGQLELLSRLVERGIDSFQPPA
jgi:MFS family permease